MYRGGIADDMNAETLQPWFVQTRRTLQSVQRIKDIIMKEKLKINVSSLAFESREIRKQVNQIKRKSPLRGADPRAQEMTYHRVNVLRPDSRATQLLYGFIRKVPYSVIERKADHSHRKWEDTKKRLRNKCRKFKVEYADLERWLSVESVKVG